MKISLNILNIILFGVLRPWLEINNSQDTFREKLNPSFRNEKETPEEFERELGESLKGHPFSATLAAIAGAFIGKKLLNKVTLTIIQKLVAIMLIIISLALGIGII